MRLSKQICLIALGVLETSYAPITEQAAKNMRVKFMQIGQI